jgi:hypothetical protein
MDQTEITVSWLNLMNSSSTETRGPLDQILKVMVMTDQPACHYQNKSGSFNNSDYQGFWVWEADGNRDSDDENH